jgi:hypothetical protein
MRPIEGETETVFPRSQNPRTELPVVRSLTNPSLEREASCRRFNWAAVANPRISVWSIVDKSLLRLFDYLPLQRGGKQ